MAAQEEYQPRFLAFCRAARAVPWEVNGPRWNRDFIFWVQKRRAEWKSLHGKKPTDYLSAADEEAFTDWLAEWRPAHG